MIALVLWLFALLLTVWLFRSTPSKSFWRLVSRKPDDAYEWFLTQPSWLIIIPTKGAAKTTPDRSVYDGPFHLWVPKLGGEHICLYSEAKTINQSQAEFLTIHSHQAKICFPWASHLFLLYPSIAVAYFSTKTGARGIEALAYGLSQLGYLLIAAALIAGTFRALGLERRSYTFVAGVVIALLGTVILNV